MPLMTITEAAVTRAKPGRTLRDDRVPGFVCVVGKKTKTFRFESEYAVAGKRKAHSISLGHWPHVSVANAREAAKVAAAKRPRRTNESGFNPAITLDEAMIAFVADRRAAGPKAQGWAKQCERHYGWFMRDRWGGRTLLSLSNAPLEVRTWHTNITQVNGPSAANHAGRILRAVYNHAKKANRGLPEENPTSAIKWNTEKRRDAAIPDLVAWKSKVDVYGEESNPLYACWYRLNVLTGARPSELARLRKDRIDFDRHVMVVDVSKDGADIEIPMSEAIERELKTALAAAEDLGLDSEWVFPATRKTAKHGHITRLRTDHFVGGNSGRHTHRTVAAALGIDEFSIDLLQGRTPSGVGRGYVTRAVMMGLSLLDQQEKISQKIEELWSSAKLPRAKPKRAA